MTLRFLLLSITLGFLMSCESGTTPTDPTLGAIIGKVLDSSMNPVSQALINTDPPTGQVLSGSDGSYVIDNVLPGVYLISATQGVEFSGSATVRVLAGKPTTANIIISNYGYNEGLLKGVVYNAGIVAEPGVTITTIPATRTTTTAPDGSFYLPHIKAGKYKVVADKAGYGRSAAEIDVAAGKTAFLELVLNDKVNLTFESLVGYYPFEGNGDDLSGTGQHLTLEAASFTASRFGDSSQALLTNGFTTKGIAGHHDIYNVPEITVAAWIKLPKPVLGPSEGMSIFSHYISASSNGFSLFFLGNEIEWFYGGGGFTFCKADNTSIANDNWHLVVATANATGSQLYFDGERVASNNWNLNVSTPTQVCPFEVGHIGSDNKTKLFNGAIDDIRIYSKVLSESEIQQLWEDK